GTPRPAEADPPTCPDRVSCAGGMSGSSFSRSSPGVGLEAGASAGDGSGWAVAECSETATTIAGAAHAIQGFLPLPPSYPPRWRAGKPWKPCAVRSRLRLSMTGAPDSGTEDATVETVELPGRVSRGPWLLEVGSQETSHAAVLRVGERITLGSGRRADVRVPD